MHTLRIDADYDGEKKMEAPVMAFDVMKTYALTIEPTGQRLEVNLCRDGRCWFTDTYGKKRYGMDFAAWVEFCRVLEAMSRGPVEPV